jgi:hypothetical protein
MNEPLGMNTGKVKALTTLLCCFLVTLLGVAQTSTKGSSSVLEVDVCIYGANSAGVIAAYTAVMQGRTVALLEPGTHLGGLSSGGLGYTDIGNKYVITGLARDFYRRMGKHYGKFEQWVFEPHVAKNIFQAYLDKAGIKVQYNRRVVAVTKSSKTIQAITTESSLQPGKQSHTQVKAKVFLDCSYEGDVMAKAGISYTIGRESNATYGETYNGVQLMMHHQFPDGIDPYVIPGQKESGLVWGVSKEKLASTGSGDKKVQAYNFRICLTDSAANQVPITRPDGYDSSKYELLLRVFEKQKDLPLNHNYLKMDPIPNRKTDVNNKGPLSTDMIGENYAYPEANYQTREKIINAHEVYTKGLLYFMGHDNRVPEHLRSSILKWGYPRDEFQDNGHWPPQLYIREARRMIGEYVMTQANCQGQAQVEDAVGMAAYMMDSHNCQRIVIEKDGVLMVKNEGDVEIGGFPPYGISYRSLVPKRSECTNLLVPVCLSASHIAFGSIRMEPVFMVLAQSAAMAAVQAIEQGKFIQDIDVYKLQSNLKRDPLADGSTPEILVDNDITPGQVQRSGRWKEEKGGTAQLGGSYARSVLMSDSTDLSSSVKFVFPQDIKGKYRIYFYNAGSPVYKAAKYEMAMQLGAAEVRLIVPTSANHYEWIPVGQFEFNGSGQAWMEINRQSLKGAIFADAVLLVPAYPNTEPFSK